MIMARVLTVATGGVEIPFSEVQKREEEQVLMPQKDDVVE